MGKRSNFKRRPQDRYDTPYECVPSLMPHLKPQARFCEPCAGKGALIDHLYQHDIICVGAWDIKPRHRNVAKLDALTHNAGNAKHYDCFITNPPWTREILHPLIVHLSDQAPTWLLFDADWAHTKQAIPYLPRCQKIVPIGRVKWIPNSKHTGKDNAAWYLFDYRAGIPTLPTFWPRLP